MTAKRVYFNNNITSYDAAKELYDKIRKLLNFHKVYYLYRTMAPLSEKCGDYHVVEIYRINLIEKYIYDKKVWMYELGYSFYDSSLKITISSDYINAVHSDLIMLYSK